MKKERPLAARARKLQEAVTRLFEGQAPAAKAKPEHKSGRAKTASPAGSSKTTAGKARKARR